MGDMTSINILSAIVHTCYFQFMHKNVKIALLTNLGMYLFRVHSTKEIKIKLTGKFVKLTIWLKGCFYTKQDVTGNDILSD